MLLPHPVGLKNCSWPCTQESLLAGNEGTHEVVELVPRPRAEFSSLFQVTPAVLITVVCVCMSVCMRETVCICVLDYV